MSQLDQAKKEAKRLFNLAKSQSPDENNIHLKINNLSSAREYVAIMNGSKNWHELEQNLKRKDSVFSHLDKNTENKEKRNIKYHYPYYLEEKHFTHIRYQIQEQGGQLIIQQPHQPIEIAHTQKKKLFQKEITSVIATHYPMILTGSTGAGTTETLLSFCSQYINNHEGVIYFDAQGDNALYNKMFSYMNEARRVQDLYVLNFMSGNRDVSTIKNEELSHSIDPINPMVGECDYFNTFFGDMGRVIHEILLSLHHKQELLSISSLESLLMFHNLISWFKNNEFGELPALKAYLEKTGLDTTQETYTPEELEEALENHAHLAHQAYQIINVFKQYPHIFKHDCSVNMERIMLDRKVLTVLLPALEKCTDEIALLGEVLLYQVIHFDNKYQSYRMHFQNIILTEFNYYTKYHSKKMSQIISKSHNNYVLKAYDFHYDKQAFFSYILPEIKTFIVMKMESFYLPDKLKIDMLDHMEQVPPIFYVGKNKCYVDKWGPLNDQMEGEAIVFMNSTSYTHYHTEELATRFEGKTIFNQIGQYQVERVRCIYFPAPRLNKIYLVPHVLPQTYFIKE